MARSLLEASKAKQNGAISWDEYIHTFLIRAAGEKHENDWTEGSGLRDTDPFGFITWAWTRTCGRIEDISPLEAVFKAYRHGTLEDTKSKLAELKKPPVTAQAAKGVKGSLALLACQERRADVLKICLEQRDLPIAPQLIEEGERVDARKDPETFKVVWESEKFRQYKEMQDRNRERGWGWGWQSPFEWGGVCPINW